MSYRRNKNLQDILVHTALNKEIRTTPIFLTLSTFITHVPVSPSRRPSHYSPATSSTPYSADYAGASMWEKQEPPSNRDYTSTYTTFKKEQTIKDYIATSSPITLLTFYCQVLRPTPVGPWARGELQREGGFIGCPPQPLMASMTTHLATPFVPVLTITSPASFL